jgi:muramoyltetrapeptide carboxypeptidase
MGQIFFIMITPPPIKPGESIGIIATARKITPEEVNYAVNFIEDQGFVPVLADNLFLSDHQFAGSDEQRVSALQNMLNDPDMKALLAVRGGYGSVRIIDRLDFTIFQKNPKWVAGYSDFTVFLNHIPSLYNIETLHATMPINFQENTPEAVNSLFEVLRGKRPNYRIENGDVLISGEAHGKLMGGNLSVLYSLLGSVSFPDLDGAVLFLEDLDEYLYHVDRMMQALKRAGKLKNLAGLVIGAMTDMHDNATPFGKEAEQIILDSVKSYNYPVVSGFPAGHIQNNSPLIIGAPCHLKTSNNSYSLSFG